MAELEAFVKFSGIDGSYTEKDFPEKDDLVKCSRLFSFGYDLTRKKSENNLCAYGEFTLKKRMDAATQRLYKTYFDQNFARNEEGKQIKEVVPVPKVVISVFRGQFIITDESKANVKERSLRYELTNCFILSMSSSVGGDGGHSDDITLSFETMDMIFYPNKITQSDKQKKKA
ncbi:MAG: type VI secretion system tube protein Hcp, partial [Puniceicoccales bacterium]|nr:type VI secretion system tube protein Hcp [Puniceicoccales bacterium]